MWKSERSRSSMGAVFHVDFTVRCLEPKAPALEPLPTVRRTRRTVAGRRRPLARMP